jgi:hypothetical protein
MSAEFAVVKHVSLYKAHWSVTFNSDICSTLI